MAVAGTAAWRAYRSGAAPPLLLGWLGLAAQAALTAAAITMGRQSLSTYLAMSSRYGVHM